MNFCKQCQTFLLTAVTCLFTLTAYCTDYWISASNGSDSNGNGTEGNPWKSINYALARIAPNQGHVLRMKAGSYTENTIIVLPDGVDIVGAGSGSTSVRVNSFYNMLDFPVGNCNNNQAGYENYDLVPEKFVIQVEGKNQLLKGFALVGQVDGATGRKKNHGGIYAKNVENFVIDDLKLDNFFLSGIWMGKSINSEIKNSSIINCAWGNQKSSYANILFWDCQNLRVNNCKIEVNDSGNYGMKTWAPRWSRICGTHEGINDYNYTTPINILVYNSEIRVKEKGTWGGGAPSISIEFYRCTPRNCQIYDNIIDNHVSFAGFTASIAQYTGVTARVFNNLFNLGSGYRYAIESNVSNLEIDHNYFYGGYYPIAQFEANRGTDFVNQKIHHNVFYGPKGYGSGSDQNFMNYKSIPDNFKFYNNTLIDTLGIKDKGLISSTRTRKSTGGEFVNNVFIKTVSNTRTLLNLDYFDAPVLKNNLFYNIPAFGSSNVVIGTSTPLSQIFKRNGSKPKPYFELATGSPAIDEGAVIAGITDGYAGAAPDLGAYESAASSTGSINSGSIYELEPKSAPGKRLDVEGNGTVRGTNVDIYQDNNQNNQAWKLVSISTGIYELTPQNATGLRLDVADGAATAGTNVQISTANSTPAQRWKLVDVGGGYYELEPQNAPGLRLDIQDGLTADGTNVRIWRGNSTDAQRWKPILKGTPGGRAAEQLSATEGARLLVYPNPSDGKAIYVEAVNANEARVELRNTVGMAVPFRKQVLSERQLRLTPQTSLVPGLYIVTVEVMNQTLTRKLLIN